MTWAIGAPPSEKEKRSAYPPDIDLSVNRLPAGAKSPVLVRVVIAVDENGRVVDCVEAPPAPGAEHSKRFPELAEIACRQMTTTFTAAPAKDPSGKAVRSVQNAFVVFETGKTD